MRRAAALLLLALAACAVPPGTGPAARELSLVLPLDGQLLAGTVTAAATGRGGDLEGLTFTLSGDTTPARSDGTALLDTRGLPDGPATLRASATIGGEDVQDSVEVTIDNSLADEATLGPAGGALRSPGGSLAIVPPGALTGSAAVRARDLDQAEILDRFAVDYGALGVTFLGALELEADRALDLARPLQVDLAGWAAGVQDDHQVLMFTLAPDADGDGVGELMMAAAAEVAGSSVVTRPPPPVEVYGFGLASQRFAPQQRGDARPGELVTVAARGFVAGGLLSTAAEVGDHRLLARTSVEVQDDFSPLVTVRFAVPLAGAGEPVRFVNLSTGYRSAPLTLDVGAPATGDAWAGLLEQLDAAVVGLFEGRPGPAALASARLDALRAAEPGAGGAMAAASGLVSDANLALLDAIDSAGYDDAQRTLVADHALLLDALATSVSQLAPAAELARLLLVADPTTVPGAVAAGATLRGQQTGGSSCSPSGIVIDFSPGSAPTGMGSAPPPGGSVCGSGAGGSGATALGGQQEGGVGAVSGAIVRVFRAGSAERLSPFTQLSDGAGYFHIPFVAAGEPFTLQAVDPATGLVASAQGVGVPFGQSLVLPLLFAPPGGVGAPTASFDATLIEAGPPLLYRFDASASTDPDGTIASYLWSFGDGTTVSCPGADGAVLDPTAGVDPRCGEPGVIEYDYRVAGTFEVGLVVSDEVGNVGTAQRTLPPTPPPLRNVRLATTTPSGAEPWVLYNRTVASPDGNLLLFEEFNDTDLIGGGPADPDWLSLYLKDLGSGELRALARDASGRGDLALTPDGRYAAYLACAPGCNAAFRIDIDTGDRLEISTTSGGEPANGQVSRPYLSADGATAMFSSHATNLGGEGDSGLDVFVKDIDSGAVELVNRRSDGSAMGGGHLGLGLSADGRYVLFLHLPPAAGSPRELYRKDLDSGELLRVDSAADGTPADAAVGVFAVMSSDGRYVAFLSGAQNLVVGPQSGNTDAYLKDLATGAILRVNESAAGELSNAPVLDTDPSVALSDDGRFVAFSSSATNLSALTTGSGDPHVFLKDTVSGDIVLASATDLNVEGDGEDRSPVLTPDGRWLFVFSLAKLTAEDRDSVELDRVRDIYRIENPLWTP